MIEANSANRGIAQRSFEKLVEKINYSKEKEGKHVSIFCSFLQIYNERVFDLLNMTSKKGNLMNEKGLRVRYTKKEQFSVENLYVFECRTAEEILHLFHSGIKNKIVASHNLNHASSRSHAIFSVTVETVDPNNHDNVITSKLQLVDLAGSEKI